MGRKLSGIRAVIRQLLRDQFKSETEYEWGDNELDVYIAHCLNEVSQTCPYMAVDKTLKTSEGSKEVVITTIRDGLLYIDKVEFRVDEDPRDFRNFALWGDTLEIDTKLTPLADEKVYIYCAKVHTLTESESTLAPQLEKVLIDGVVANAALGWINQVRTQVKAAVASVAEVNAAIDNMTARIAQAVETDLPAGRLLINKINTGGRPQTDYATYAARELGNANSYLSQSQGYLRELSSRLSISGAINSYQTWANNKLVMYQRDLSRLSKPRTWRRYPGD